jgi:DNA-binding CsgD family transcriptional regulator
LIIAEAISYHDRLAARSLFGFGLSLQHKMEQIGGLYRIMLLLSAVVMLLGLIMHLSRRGSKSSVMKMMLMMAGFNILSIAAFLLNFASGNRSDWQIAFVFIDSVILILNLIIARYVYQAYADQEKGYERQIISLFVVTVLSDCIFLFLVYFFRRANAFFSLEGEGFIIVFSFSGILLLWGTIIPAIRALRDLFRRDHRYNRLLLLIILNMLNNVIGLFFYTLKFPTPTASLVMNMLVNLVFAYYFGYYLLSEYFILKRSATETNAISQSASYSWDVLKTRLNHWSEARSYLITFYPDIIKEVDAYKLSDLEKIHLMLKRLKIKAKDVAQALNISIRAVEMQRYRIGKKTGGN